MSWQERCKAAGGEPRVFPYPTISIPDPGGKPGDPACRFATGTTPAYRYEDANLSFSERLSRTLEDVSIARDRALGAVVEARDRALEGGALGIASRVLGVNKYLLGAAAVAVGFLLLRDALPELTGGK